MTFAVDWALNNKYLSIYHMTTYLSFTTKRAKFALKLRMHVIITRNRLEVLLFVFVASYFLYCGDKRPTDKVTVSRTPVINKTEEEGTTDRRPTQLTPDTSVTPDLATQILEAIQQQNAKYQSLEANMNLMC